LGLGLGSGVGAGLEAVQCTGRRSLVLPPRRAYTWLGLGLGARARVRARVGARG